MPIDAVFVGLLIVDEQGLVGANRELFLAERFEPRGAKAILLEALEHDVAGIGDFADVDHRRRRLTLKTDDLRRRLKPFGATELDVQITEQLIAGRRFVGGTGCRQVLDRRWRRDAARRWRGWNSRHSRTGGGTGRRLGVAPRQHWQQEERCPGEAPTTRRRAQAEWPFLHGLPPKIGEERGRRTIKREAE